MVKKILIGVLLSVPCALAMEETPFANGVATEHSNGHAKKKRGSMLLESESDDENTTEETKSKHRRINGHMSLEVPDSNGKHSVEDHSEAGSTSSSPAPERKAALSSSDESSNHTKQDKNTTPNSLPGSLKSIKHSFNTLEIWCGTTLALALTYLLYSDISEVLAARAKLMQIEKAKQSQVSALIA
jgi:hypothetical protein